MAGYHSTAVASAVGPKFQNARVLWRNAVAQKSRGLAGTIGQRQGVHVDLSFYGDGSFC